MKNNQCDSIKNNQEQINLDNPNHKDILPYNNSNNYRKLSKRLARIGIASRRDCDAMIENGEVKINNQIVFEHSYYVSDEDLISIKGKIISNRIPPLKVYIFNKPTKCIVSKKDEKEYEVLEDDKIKFRSEDRVSVFDLMPKQCSKLIAIGRLDFNTEGLLLFTNCGEYAKDLESPESKVIRTYTVKVFGYIDDKKLNKLKDGIRIDGITYDKFQVFLNRKCEPYSFLTIKITEGKNREIRKALKYCGLTVVSLKRINYGGYKLTGFKAGEISEVKKILFFGQAKDIIRSKKPTTCQVKNTQPARLLNKNRKIIQKACT